MKDAFGTELNINDTVLLMNQSPSAYFKSFLKGMVIGFTEKYVKIKTNYSNKIIYRKSYRLIVSEDWKSKYMYLLADTENIRKRLLQENNNIKKYNNEILLKELLVIIDDFERGFKNINNTKENISEETRDLIEGFYIIYKNFCKKLKDIGLSDIKINEGDKFDTNIMNCISILNVPGKINDTVLSVSKKGYIYKDKIIRYADVIVNKE